MMTWRLDQLGRSAVVCLTVATALGVAMAFLVEAVGDGRLGGLLVAVLIVGLGGLLGSMTIAGFGVLVFAILTTFAEPSVALMMAVASALVVMMFAIDLSVSMRRSPLIDRSVWRDAAFNVALVVPLALGVFAIAWFAATATTWHAIVLPLGVLALGYAFRFGADAHTRRTRRS